LALENYFLLIAAIMHSRAMTGKWRLKSTERAIRVAVIDDDQSIREALIGLLKACGYEAVAFSSASDFISFDSHSGFACLLIDMYMPGMTGLELLRWLNKAGTSSPAILMSSEDGLRLSSDASRLGARTFIEKSRGFDELIDAVNKIAHG
jgi:FixJ family two-component response regulator